MDIPLLGLGPPGFFETLKVLFRVVDHVCLPWMPDEPGGVGTVSDRRTPSCNIRSIRSDLSAPTRKAQFADGG